MLSFFHDRMTTASSSLAGTHLVILLAKALEDGCSEACWHSLPTDRSKVLGREFEDSDCLLGSADQVALETKSHCEEVPKDHMDVDYVKLPEVIIQDSFWTRMGLLRLGFLPFLRWPLRLILF